MDKKLLSQDRIVHWELKNAKPLILKLIDRFNKLLGEKCPGSNLSIEFDLTIHEDIDDADGKIYIIDKKSNKTLSEIVLFFETSEDDDDRPTDITIKSVTDQKYYGYKYNQLLRAVCVYIFSATQNGYNNILSKPNNPISSYLLMSRFNYKFEGVPHWELRGEGRREAKRLIQQQYEEIKKKTGDDTRELTNALKKAKITYNLYIPLNEENKKKADIIIHESLLDIKNGKLRCPSDEKLQGGTNTNKIVSTVLTYSFYIAVIILFVLLLIYIIQNHTEYTVFNSFNNPIDKYINNIL